MYRGVLATVNEHLNSEVAAWYALRIADTIRAKFYVAFIAEKDLSRSAIKRGEEAQARLFHSAKEIGLEAVAITETGEPAKKLNEIVRGADIDIVFASTRRADIERRFYAGTVARRLSLTLPCSVAIVRVVHAGRAHPSKILVPLKARVNHIAERAYFCATLARAFGAGLYIFHVQKPISRFFHGEIHLRPIELEKRLPKDIIAFINELSSYGIEQMSGSVSGSEGRSIATEALSKRHDLIIMGASRRGLLSSVIKGNPVEEVLRETPCDLIILNPKLKQ